MEGGGSPPKKGLSRETRAFFFFAAVCSGAGQVRFRRTRRPGPFPDPFSGESVCPYPFRSAFVQFFAAYRDLDGAQRVAADVVGIVAENDAFGRDTEILRGADLFGEEALCGQLLLVPRTVLPAEFAQDQFVETLRLLLGEEIGRRDFIPLCERVGVVFGLVDAVCAARVARPRDDVGEQRILHAALRFDRYFVGLRRPDVRRVDRVDLPDGGGDRFPYRPGLLPGLEEVADVGLLDGLQRRGFRGVQDRGEPVFDPASGVAVSEQRIDAHGPECGAYRASGAGDGQQECGGRQQECFFHGGRVKGVMSG